MTSWYSQLLTTTTSRITNLQRSLLSSDADGDTEDDTHVCRVLRNYYTEKGRPFPGWLPPDPKAPPPPAPVYASPPSQVGSRYGGLVSNGQQGGGGLSSLWDSNAGSLRQDPQSLRQGRGIPPPARDVQSSRNPFANNRGSGGSEREEVQARPLPSQRAGSYQQTGYSREGSGSGGGGGGGSAQDRLKQRLYGARSASPASSPYQPPPPQQSQKSSRYGSSGGGGSSNGDYEDRFAPGGMYDAGPSYGTGSSRGGGSDRPFMAADAPWASNEYEYGGGSRSGGGLPSGPRQGGLPGGPRRR